MKHYLSRPDQRVRVAKNAALKPFVRPLIAVTVMSIALESPIALGNGAAVAAGTAPAIALGNTKPLGSEMWSLGSNRTVEVTKRLSAFHSMTPH